MPNEGKQGDEETQRRGEGRWRAQNFGFLFDLSSPRLLLASPSIRCKRVSFLAGGEALETA